MYIDTEIYKYVHINLHTYVHTQYIYIYTYIYVHIYCIYLYTHIYIHLFIYIYTFIYVCVYVDKKKSKLLDYVWFRKPGRTKFVIFTGTLTKENVCLQVIKPYETKQISLNYTLCYKTGREKLSSSQNCVPTTRPAS